MSAVFKLSNWEKFSILSWKNLYGVLKHCREGLRIILIPPLFCIILVILRNLTEAQYEHILVYRDLETNQSWSRFLEQIEARRIKIKQTKPDFKHSVFVPQPIVAFAPNADIPLLIMQKAIEYDIRRVGIRQFKSCDELKATMEIEHFFAGVCFKSDEKNSLNMEINIVFPSELRFYNDSFIGANWKTDHMYDHDSSFDERQFSGHDGGYVGYLREGFVAIQNAVAMAYIRFLTGKNFPTPKVQRFPGSAKWKDKLIESIQISLSLVLVCGFIYPALTLTHNIVEEKKRNVKKILKVMGVGNWIQISAWFAKYFVFMSISSFLVILLLKIQWNSHRGILPNSSIIALQLCLIAYITAAISFAIMMSAFFSDPEIGVPVTGIIWISSYLPFIPIAREELFYLQPLMCCFFNPVLGFLFENILLFEKYGKGLQMSSLAERTTLKWTRSATFYILILFALSIAHILIALYVDDFRFNQKILFKKCDLRFRQKDDVSRRAHRNIAYNRQAGVFEIEHSQRKVVIAIENLSKSFNGVYAVNNVNMTVHEGDIIVLMGHNGSGKTVLLRMIAGMLTPTTGKIEIQGLDAEKNKYLARRILGISLNSDLLFPELDVIDQLIFFGRLRGLFSPQLENEVEKYLDVMHMHHRIHSPTNLLSKGEQRFLSVCCALIGGSKIILLDEPSMHLDLVAKESLWELLRSECKTRSIILATNSGDEAEALGDHIGVFSCGELKCFGSSFFLKKVYGLGHRLICYKRPDFQKDILLNLIQGHTPIVTIESEIGNQISFILDDIKSFLNLLDVLENNAEKIGVSGISVAEMNLADIFFKVGVEKPNDGNQQHHRNMTSGDLPYTKDTSELLLDGGARKVTECCPFLNQFEAMLLKRIHSFLRTVTLSFLQLTLPIILTIVSFSLSPHGQERNLLPDMKYDLQQYPSSVTFYHMTSMAALNQDNINIIEAYEEELHRAGIGHRAEKVPTGVPGFNRYILQNQEGWSEFKKINYLVGVHINSNFITALFKNQLLHTLPLTLNLVHNAILRGLKTGARIQTIFSPLPFTSDHDIISKRLPFNSGNYLTVNIAFCSSFIWSLSVIFLVRERKSDFKFFQILFGVHSYVFWLSTFIFDILIIVVTFFIIFLTISCLEIDIFSKRETPDLSFFIIIIMGICMCSLNYLVSVTWRNPIAAYIAITIFNTAGIVSFWVYLEFSTRGFGGHKTSELFESIMRVFPYFSFSKTLMKSLISTEFKDLCHQEEMKIHFDNLEECEISPKCCRSFSIWEFEGGVLSDLIYVIGYGLACWILLFVVENCNMWSRKIRYGTSKPESKKHISESYFDSQSTNNMRELFEEMAADEELKVLRINPISNRDKVLVCKRLSCEIGAQLLLNKITFAVNRGECFTILGKNASGKTTLLKTLIGRAPLSFGRVHIDGVNFRKDFNSIYQRIGYCAQDEIFLNEYKLFEYMQMACLLRGIPKRKAKDIVEYLAVVLGFHTSLQKRYETCSRGIQRRFHCACAFIGNPKIIFFDCALSSLDIAGRRQLLRVVSELRAKGISFVFTATEAKHYQKVTDRISLLSYGRQIWLTDPWSMCQNYPNGYILKVKVRKIMIQMLANSNESLVTPKYSAISTNTFLKLANFIENEFSLFQIKGQYGNFIEYFIPFQNNSISHMYKVMQRNLFNLYVEDFTITSYNLATIVTETMRQEQISS